MSKTLYLTFGRHKKNNEILATIPKKNIYDVFESNTVNAIDTTKYDKLVLGRGTGIPLKNLIKLPKNKYQNPLYETYDLIEQFISQKKPVIGFFYGAQVLNSYFNGSIQSNEKDKITLITDQRFAINKNVAKSKQYTCSYNYNIKNLGDNLKSIAYTNNNTKDSYAFKHINKPVYGFMFFDKTLFNAL